MQPGDDGDSPYTNALTQIIRKPGLEIFRTFNQVGLTVSRATGGAQHKLLNRIALQDSVSDKRVRTTFRDELAELLAAQATMAGFEPATPSSRTRWRSA